MYSTRKRRWITAVIVIIALALPALTSAAVGDLYLASVSSGGTKGNGSSHMIDLSADGRYLVFKSSATNLITGDSEGYVDIFHHDTQTGITTRVSLTDDGDGTAANDDCDNPAVSGDGRYVAFDSYADNLEDDDIWSRSDVFRHDTVTGETILVSRNTAENLGSASSFEPDISNDGRYVVFESYANNMDPGDTDLDYDIFLRDTQTTTTTIISINSDGTTYGNDNSINPVISADGRYVAFESDASTLVTGDTLGHKDIFRHDTQTGTTIRVSVKSDGTEANGSSYVADISADGRYIAFNSLASNLVNGDTNGVLDVFMHDTITGITIRISTTSTGTEVSNSSTSPAISADGTYVTFHSSSDNLVAGDSNNATDCFVKNTQTGAISLISKAEDGTPVGTGTSAVDSEISDDGVFVGFRTNATTLYPGDTDGYYDLYRVNFLAPEIDLKGNGISIPNNDGAPSIDDDTDFGDVSVVSGTVSHTFTIENTGSANLTLTGIPKVNITGNHAADFSISALPATIITPGGSTTFEITFNPSASGLRSAAINIDNDDSDENPYNFKIQGTGTVPAIDDTIGMYSRSQKTWYLKDANDDGWGDITTVRFGSTDSSWIPVAGDWNGNGTDTIAMYSRTQKTWYLKGSNTDGWGGITTVRFGSTDSSWIPVAGDWNGNGTDTIAMYSRTQKTWYLKGANNDGWGNVTTVRFGSTDSSWIPVAGDWNGNGTDTIAMYSRSQKTWYLKGANNDGWGNITTVRFGSTDSSWIPVAGDWNANGTDTIGMYSRTQKTWYLKDANDDGWGNVTTVRFGSTDASWVPVAGKW